MNRTRVIKILPLQISPKNLILEGCIHKRKILLFLNLKINQHASHEKMINSSII